MNLPALSLLARARPLVGGGECSGEGSALLASEQGGFIESHTVRDREGEEREGAQKVKQKECGGWGGETAPRMTQEGGLLLVLSVGGKRCAGTGPPPSPVERLEVEWKPLPVSCLGRF